MNDDCKGALLQRDDRTYAVTTRIPAGIVTPEQLETIARVGREYRVPIMKITSGQRIILAGLEPGDVQKVLTDLGPLAKPETAPCVKFVQACLGTDMCRYGKQDSIGLARALDTTFKDKTFPERSRSGFPAVPAVAAKATPGTSGLSQRRTDGRCSSGVTLAHGPGLAILSPGTSLLTKLLIVLSVLLSTTAAMQNRTSVQPALWNGPVSNH